MVLDTGIEGLIYVRQVIYCIPSSQICLCGIGDTRFYYYFAVIRLLAMSLKF